MSKFITGLAVVIVLIGAVVVALLAGQTALTDAQANLSQANANTMQASANLVSQCLTGFLVLVALVAGGAVGFNLGKLRPRQSNPTKRQGAWLPGPGARWQRRNAAPVSLPTHPHITPQMPAGYYPPAAYPALPSSAQPETYVMAAPEEDDEGNEWLETWWQ